MVHEHFKWYREHTAIKHAILKDYLGAWVGILSTWNDKVAYIDGFCGPGYYEDGDELQDGSPIIALKIADHFSDRIDVVCIFIDKNEECCEELEERICTLGFEVKYDIVCNEFEEALTEILDDTPNIVPAFCFIDPFGYAGLPFNLIERFLKRPTTEAFINFMYDPISRWISEESQHDHLDRLFGTDEWREVLDRDLRKERREIFLRDLYHEQLKTCAKHIWPFKLQDPDKARTLYYLFHCTNHPKGIKEMKKVMYKEGTTGTYSYMGKEDSQMSLFSTEPSIDELKDTLLREFDGEKITFDEIVNSTLDWPYIDKNYRTALMSLRKEEKIEKIPVTTMTVGRGFNGKDVADFSKKPKKKRKLRGFGLVD